MITMGLRALFRQKGKKDLVQQPLGISEVDIPSGSAFNRSFTLSLLSKEMNLLLTDLSSQVYIVINIG